MHEHVKNPRFGQVFCKIPNIVWLGLLPSLTPTPNPYTESLTKRG